MKYKYLKGSEADFDGAPGWAIMKTKECGIIYFVEGHYEGDKFMSENGRLGQIENGDNDFSSVMVIAHRELINAAEVNGDTYLAQAIQNAAQDVSKIIDKEIKEILITPTEALITERGARYGRFKDGADIMQSLKDTMRDVDSWNNLTASQKEALDMIQHKIGRILNGDPTYDDSWKDIAGYATLIVNELNGEVK